MNTIITIFCLLLILGIYFFSCNSKSNAKSKTLDTAPFTIIAGQVFFKDTEISGIDGASFQILNEFYARDAKVILWYDTYRNSSDYFISKRIRTKFVETSDPENFRCLDYGFAHDGKQLFHDGEKVQIRDLQSLRLINDDFYADQYHVYLKHEIQLHLDGPSFQLVNANYASDKDHYYFIELNADQGKLLQKIDCEYASFNLLEYPYAVDANLVFYKDRKIPGLSAANFKILGHQYSTDGVKVFYKDLELKNADAASFLVFKENDQFLGEYVLARDKRAVYVKEREHKNADVSSFVILDEKYNKDLKSVYYRDKLIPGADPLSFEVLPHTYGDIDSQDKLSTYFEGKRVGKREKE